MTMRLRIKNEDGQRTAVVTTVDLGGDARKGAGSFELKPGQETEVYIHAGRRMHVEEKPEDDVKR